MKLATAHVSALLALSFLTFGGVATAKAPPGGVDNIEDLYDARRSQNDHEVAIQIVKKIDGEYFGAGRPTAFVNDNSPFGFSHASDDGYRLEARAKVTKRLMRRKLVGTYTVVTDEGEVSGDFSMKLPVTNQELFSVQVSPDTTLIVVAMVKKP